MGRKAGLQTAELYGALAGRKPLPHEGNVNGNDGNGFRVGFDAQGHQVYQPDKRGANG
jgi:hypothetical protein